MKAIRRKLILMIIDVISVNSAVVLAFFIGCNTDIPNKYFEFFMPVCIIVTIFCIPVFYILRLYNSLWTYAGINELILISYSTFLLALLFSVYLLILKASIPISVYVLFFFLLFMFIGTSRISYRLLRKYKYYFKSKGKKIKKNVMIIGAGDAGAIVINELMFHFEMGLMPVAVIDDDKSKHKSSIAGINIYGGREKITEIVKIKDIDEIIIAMPSASKTQLKEILDECKKTKCRLKILPGVYELIDGKVAIKNIRDVQIEDLLGRDPVKVNLNEISEYINNETILVTGAGGSIGSELCRQIAKFQPTKLLILDIYENNAYDLQLELKKEHPGLDFEVLIASVRDKARIEYIFKKYRPDVVFHAAAHKHVPLMEDNPCEAIKNNIFGTKNVAECAHKYKSRKFVLISTDKAVNPTNVMGATKRVAEMIIQSMNYQSKTEYVSVRFGNVLGSNGSVIPIFKKQIASGGPVTVTHPEINRFFMTIPEAVQLVIQAGAMARGGEIFVLDMGQPVKIVDLAKDLIRLSGLEPEIDIKIEFTGLRPGEKLYEELLMAEEGLLETKHEKIFIGKPTYSDLDSLNEELEKLRILIKDPDNNFFEYMQKLVPTYKKGKAYSVVVNDRS